MIRGFGDNMRDRLSNLTEGLLSRRKDVEPFPPATEDPEDWLDYWGGPELRGQLVHVKAQRMVRHLASPRGEGGNPITWPDHELCLSYLCRMHDGEALCIKLLHVAPEDCRYGLLFACYRMHTPGIYEAVKTSVRQWATDLWGDGTGEKSLVLAMVEKWDETFTGGVTTI